MSMRRSLAPVLLVILAQHSCICVERPRRMTEDERAKLRAHILAEPPADMQHRIGADLDGRLELLGYSLDAERDEQGRIIPGRTITVTWYWKCNEPLEDGWRLFTHVSDDTGTNRVPADDVGLIRQHYQPSQWRAGEIIADEQQLFIPDDFNSRTLTLYVGAWFGPHRLPIVNDAPNDGTGRIRIGPFPMRYDLPSVTIPQTTSVLTIDGRLDEPAWQVAAALSPFVQTPDGPPVGDRVRARALWSRRYLYVAFEVQDSLLVSQFSQRDDPIYNQDVVEVFLDENGDGRDYYEFQVSPSGVLFDLALSEPRRGEPSAFTAADFRAGVVPDGTVNDNVPDRGYTVELQIPFPALAKFRQRPPRVGSTWRANFFVLDMEGLPQEGAEPPTQVGFAWSAPRRPDFHEYRRFGEITFGGPVAEPVTPPQPQVTAPVTTAPAVSGTTGATPGTAATPPGTTAPTPAMAETQPGTPAPAPSATDQPAAATKVPAAVELLPSPVRMLRPSTLRLLEPSPSPPAESTPP